MSAHTPNPITHSCPAVAFPPPRLSRLAKKRMEAARIRHQRAVQDQRNRVAERIPMPKPAVILEKLDHGTTYTLLHWTTGHKVGEFPADIAARQARRRA